MLSGNTARVNPTIEAGATRLREMPHVPTAPWEPRAMEVRFRSGECEFHGKLYLPVSAGPHPALILVHRADPEERELYEQIAWRFALRGTAALIYDRTQARISIRSNGLSPWEAGTTDALAAARYLRSLPEIDAQRVGLWGL